MNNITPYIETINYNKMYIMTVNIDINDIINYANINVMLQSENNQKILSCTATKSELDIWSDDDSVLLDIVCNKLNINIIE
jgi:hypothetical protein